MRRSLSLVNPAQGRRSWVLRLAVGVLVAMVGAVGASGVGAAMPAPAVDRIVYPTGQYPADLQNAKAAVGQGGSILLKATDAAGAPTAFNFGPSQFSSDRVLLNGTVALLGETINASTMTTVAGGHVPVLALNGANVIIAGIDFERPFQEAIRLAVPASAKVINNRVSHVVGRLGPSGFTFATAINSFGGTITIADNVIDDVDAALGEGIGQAGALGAVEIARNRVSGTNTNAIESGPLNARAVRIVDNTLLPGPQRHPQLAAGQAIEVNGGGSYTVSGNTAVCPNPNATCIFALGASGFSDFGPLVAPVIEGNHVSTQSEAVGIALVGQVLNASVTQNRIDGSGLAALATSAVGLATGDDLASPTFVGNNTAGFSASFADVFLDIPPHDAVLVGVSGKVVDLGTNDRITGFTAIGDQQNIGRQISQAVANRNQAIQQAKASVPANLDSTP
jgi:hypothetical protein